MGAPEMPGAAAQRDAGGDPKMFDRLPGAVDGSKDNPSAPAEQDRSYHVAPLVSRYLILAEVTR